MPLIVTERQAPLALSESWDNTGLLLGDPARSVSRIQTCLTLTVETVAEAIEKKACMVIAHHPLPFKPLSKITTETPTGQLLWQLAQAGISVYSPHTAWDSAEFGINRLLSDRLELVEVEPLIPSNLPGLEHLGAGRVGRLIKPQNLEAIVSRLAALIPNCRPRGVRADRVISRVAFACGSGGSLLSAAIRRQSDLLITGEATYHNCLEAQTAGVALLMIGHFASEQFSLQELASRLAADITNLTTWLSTEETDPVRDFKQDTKPAIARF